MAQRSAASAISVTPVDVREIADLRDAFRAERSGQIVHDAIHYRRGWTVEYLLSEAGSTAGYASVAVAGPWKDRPTFYETYLTRGCRHRAFAFFDAFLETVRPPAFEVQSDDPLTTTLALARARDIGTERVVFAEHTTTGIALPGAALQSETTPDELQEAMASRQGGGRWTFLLDGARVGEGGILFHYNRPFGDVYMSIDEGFRHQGYGAYFVQELKRVCHDLGAVPAARCDPANVASQRTLQRAGFVPCAHILFGAFA